MSALPACRTWFLSDWEPEGSHQFSVSAGKQVPAGCAARPGAGVVRGKSKRLSGAPASISASGANSSTTSLSRTASTLSHASSLESSTAAGGGPPRRSVPPAFGSERSPASPSPPALPAQTSPAQQTATLLYDFTASSELELSVGAGEVVEVLQPEDASGWIKVRLPGDGREGLVPANYMQMGGASNGTVGAAAAPASATQRGAQTVPSILPLLSSSYEPRQVPFRGSCSDVCAFLRTAQALYAYAAQSEAELSLAEGDVVDLTPTGMDAAEGWAEVSNLTSSNDACHIATDVVFQPPVCSTG